MPSLATPTHRLPGNVDEHPEVQRHKRQRAELMAALISVQTDLTRLVIEREGLLREQHNATVAALLGEPVPQASDAPRARLAEIDVELQGLKSREQALQDAVAKVDVAMKRVRAQAQTDLREQLCADAREVVRTMLPVVEQLEALNAELTRLHALVGNQVGLPIPYRSAIVSPDAWFRYARAFVAEGESATGGRRA